MKLWSVLVLSFILYAFFTSVINPGDEAYHSNPCWVSYVDQVYLEGSDHLLPSKQQKKNQSQGNGRVTGSS